NISSIMKNQFKNQLTTFSALTSEITLHYYTQLSKLYKKAIEERELSLSTIYEVDMLHQMHHRFTQSAKIYERHDRAVFTPLIYSILQKIEYLQLEDIETIKRYAKDYNPDLYLQEAEMEILDIPKSYTDNVSLNLFANRRTVDELGWYNTLGVEATLPLDFSSYEKQELARLEKKALSIAHTSLQQSIDISLDRLYLAFEDLQSYITIDKDDVHYLDTRIQKFKAIKDNTIPNLNFNSDEKILLSSKKIIDLKFDILLKRVELFKILSEIANIANITDITYLIKNKSLL
ncbi:MAG: hypothetical protein U9R50_11605, partial [Campylobacterota bacterium]|nr:hypothetical protein [Campylobacterota bacterium]